jgi:NAD(P)-dependent dehydrogenase (short-subunit alcohol dehydrogenase family)
MGAPRIEAAGKVVVITGGTSGIGNACARLLVEAGASVVVAGRDPQKGERAAQALGPRARFVRADVARAREVEALVAAAVSTFGRLDWAVNAAAVGDFKPAAVADITEEEWERTIAADLTGVWLSMKYELQAMLRTGGGSIVNVSSVNGLAGTPSAGAYCAAKHGIHGLSRTAAMEYGPRNVRVNVICPGAHRTPMLEGVFAKISPDAPERAAEMYKARIPVGRIAEPEEAAHAILWLLSDAASYVTGAVLTVDGGMAAGLG